jgi:HK97 family phage major capsid protein
MNLEALRKALREKQEALKALTEKAFTADGTKEDLDAVEKASQECEDIESKIAIAEKAEATIARAAKPAVPSAESASGTVTSVPAAPEGMKGEEVLIKAISCHVVSRGTGEPVLKVMADHGMARLADALASVRVNGKAVNTLVSSEGGLLVPTPLTGGIMPLLRIESTFIAAGPQRVPLTNGQFVLARGLAGASASYVAEGALKPVSTPTFDSISMRAKKLAGIVPITKEAERWTPADVEGYVRTDLQNALALTLDLNAWLGTGAGASPTGILNKSGVQTVAQTFASPAAPTLAELDSFASAAILKLVTSNLTGRGRWRWVMPYRSAMKLADIRDGNGNAVFPEMSLSGAGGPVWKGIPVIVSQQIPTTGGAGTDETTIALVDFSHVLFGEEEGIVLKMSDQATLDVDGSGTLVHLWQQNMFAILAEAMHDFGLRTVKAVVKQSNIRW